MAARVCPYCDIAYPTIVLVCRKCNEELRFAHHRDVDEGWDDEPKVESPIPLLKCGAVKDENGRLWLYARDVLGAGWNTPVGPFQLFELLDGTLVEVQGRDEVRRRYWVEPIGVTDGGWR